MLAAAWLCVFVERSMKNQDRQRNQRKLLLQSLVGPNHRGHSLRWLSLMGDQWIVVHRLDCFGIARKSLVGKAKHMRMRRKVTQAFENRERKIGRWQLMRETLADQPRQLSLVFESVKASDDASRAVTKHEDGQARVPRFYDGRNCLDVTDAVFKGFDIEALAIRISATPQIHRVHGQAI